MIIELTSSTDSSRRAVEAADNVVHAYDLNMQIPDTPQQQNEEDGNENMSMERRPSLLMESNSVFFRKNKRPRTSSVETTPPATKHRVLQSNKSTPHRNVSPHTASLRSAVEESDEITSVMEGVLRTAQAGQGPSHHVPELESPTFRETESATTPGIRQTSIRELLHLIVNESLRVGGRPDSAVAQDTSAGEIIEVRNKHPHGRISIKTVEWFVDPRVPEVVYGWSLLDMI